jgi:uncharacterized coiled-coil protein SlyX
MAMKRIVCFLYIFFVVAAPLKAQTDVTLNLIPPPPGQLTVPDLWHLTLTSFLEEPAPVYLSAQVTAETDGEILHATSAVFTLEARDGFPVTSTISARDIEPVESATANPLYEEIVRRTGGVPAGFYAYCVHLVHAETGDMLAEDCSEVFVDPASPPEMVLPAEGDEVVEPQPVFSWIETHPPTLHYELQVFPVMDGQTAAEAVAANPSWFRSGPVSGSVFYYPVDALQLDPGTYVVQVLGVQGAAVLAGSEPVMFSWRPTFAEVTVGPCDTLRVMSVIFDGVDAIRDDLCDVKHDLMDQLLAALDDYQDRQWAADALKGELDNAATFRSNLQEMRDHSMGAMAQEVQRLENQRDECQLDWQQQFHNRYVANASVGGAQSAKQRRFDRASASASRRFERRLDAQIQSLQSSMQRTQDHYDNLMSSLDSYIQGKQADHDQAQQAADQALDNVMDLFNRIKDNLCGIDGDWQEIFAYIQANFVCVDCDETQVPVPPVMAEMEDCLKDLFAKLAGWKANIRTPDDQDMLREQANRHFDADQAMEMFNELKELLEEMDDTVDAFNRSSGSVQIMDRACGELQTYASGGRSLGRFSTPRTPGRGANYGAAGGVKTFGYNATGEYAPSSQQRRDARRERREFMLRNRERMSSINSMVAQMSRGFNGRGIENGFADDQALEAHGKAAAVPFHEHTAESLDRLIDLMLNELRNCYNVGSHHRNRIRFNRMMDECVDFQQALRDLDDKYADHAEETDEMEAWLRNRLAWLEELIRSLERRAAQSDDFVSGLEDMIRDLKQRLNDIRNTPVHPDHESEKRDIIDHLEGRIKELEDKLADAAGSQSEAEETLAELKRLRDRIQAELDGFGDITPPSPLGSRDDVDEASGKIDDERDEKEKKGQEITGLLDEAEDMAGEVSDHLRDAFRDAANGLGAGRRIGGSMSAEEEHLRRLEEARRQRELLRKQTDCLRVLEEYREKYESEPGILKQIWDWFWDAKDELDEFPEGLLDDVDKAKEYLDKLEEYKDRIEQIITLINGINTDDPVARAEAFGEVLKLAEELAGKVPGFGDMIAYYAAAYEAAIRGIQQIAEDLRKPAIDLIDNYKIECSPCNWEGKPLDEILDAEWEKFRRGGPTASGLQIPRLVLGYYNPAQLRIIEQYFKDSIAKQILECCIDTLLEN